MGIIRRQSIKNTVITYAGILIGAANMIFVQPRFLSEEELGFTRLLYFCATLIGLLVPIGLPNVIVKFFPFVKNEQRRHHGFPGLVLTVFMAGFALCALGVWLLQPAIAGFYGKNSPLFVEYISFLLPFTLITAGIAVTSAYCQSLFKSTVPSFLNDVCVRIGITVVTLLYFNRWLSFDGYVLAYTGIYAAELVILAAFVLAVDRPGLRWSAELFRIVPFRRMIGFGLMMCLATFASYGLKVVDGVILGRYSLALVGVYTTAVFIAAFIEVPLGAMERITHTKIADFYARNDMDSISRVYRDSVAWLLLAGGFLFVGINACARHVYELGRLPASYTSAIAVVYIVSFGALVNVSTGINSSIIFYSDHYKRGTWYMALTLAFAVALNLVLIPVIGIYGAAIASLSGSVVFNFIKFFVIYREFGLQPYTAKSAVCIASVAVCAALSHLLPDTGIPLADIVYKGILSCGLFAALAWRLRLLPAELPMPGRFAGVFRRKT